MKKNLMILGMSALVIGMSFGAVACSAKRAAQAEKAWHPQVI